MTVIDRVRDRLGFLRVEEVIELAKRNFILDPFSVLIGRGVVIGKDNTFYPSVVLQLSGPGALRLGSGNKFFPGFLALSDGGEIEIEIGDGNQFGDGPVSLKAKVADARRLRSRSGESTCRTCSCRSRKRLGSRRWHGVHEKGAAPRFR